MKKRLIVILTAAVILLSATVFTAVVHASEDYAASIGDVKYDTLEAAVKAAGTVDEETNEAIGTTILLNKNITISSTISISKSGTITIQSPEGTSYKITYTGSGKAFNLNSKLFMRRTVIESPNGGGFNLGEGADLKLRNCSIISAGENSTSAPIQFTASGAKLDSQNTDMSGKFSLVYAGTHSVECKFDGGTYHMTGSYDEGILHGDGSGGRLLQFANASDAESKVTIENGNFIAHYGYVFNFSQPGCKVEVNGGNFYYDGPDRNLMILKHNASITIRGGIFNTPSIGSAISLDTAESTSATLVPSATVYGGTFMCKGGSPIGVGKKTIKNESDVVVDQYVAKLNVYGGAFFDIYNNVEMDLSDVKPQRIAGASVSLDSAKPAIRFDSVITQKTINEITAKSGTSLTYGTLIVPEETVKSLGSKNEILSGVNGFNFDIIAAAGLVEGTDYYNYPCRLVATADGNYRIYAIHPLAQGDYATQFSAVSYIKYTLGGNEYYICSNYNGGDTRSAKDIAFRALADYDANKDNENYEYTFTYTDEQLSMLKEYNKDIKIESNKYMTAKVLSLNILTTQPNSSSGYAYYGNQNYSHYSWKARLEYVKAMYEYAKPDVMLFQEYSGKDYWGNAIELTPTDSTEHFYTAKNKTTGEDLFPGFVWVNHQNRRGNTYVDNYNTAWKADGTPTASTNGSANAFHAHNFVLYDSTKFKYIASGTEFVSKSGKRDYQQPGKDSDTSSLLHNWHYKNPSCEAQDDLGDYTWVVLEDKNTGLQAIYVSIHTYNGSVQKYAYMLDNLQCLTEKLYKKSSDIYGNIPVIVGGDFNLTQGSTLLDRCYTHMTDIAHYTDSRITGSNSGTARSFGGSRLGGGGSSYHGSRIDYIFVNGADTYGYEVMNGQVKKVGPSYVYDPYADLDSGNSYDISDHLPLFTTVVIGDTGTYNIKASESSDKYFKNPNTQNDVTSSATVTGVTSATVNSSALYGSQYVAASKVNTNGTNAWRIMATDETNHVNAMINTGTKSLSGISKIRITYKTEMTLNNATRGGHAPDKGNAYPSDNNRGPDLRFIVGEIETDLDTTKNGVWKTVEIDVSSISTSISGIQLYGRYYGTGLCQGDAVYISSIEFVQ